MKKILFLFLSITISSLAQIKDAKFYYDYAIDSLWGFDNRLAIEYINKAIQLDSLNSEYIYNRSRIYNDLGNELMALANINKAINIDSSKSKYHYWKSLYAFYNEKDSVALNSINKALEIDSSDSWNIFSKAMILEQLGQYESAKRYYSTLLNSDEFDRAQIEKNISYLEEVELNKDFTRVGVYYPFNWLESQDTLNYPLDINFELNLFDVKAFF